MDSHDDKLRGDEQSQRLAEIVKLLGDLPQRLREAMRRRRGPRLRLTRAEDAGAPLVDPKAAQEFKGLFSGSGIFGELAGSIGAFILALLSKIKKETEKPIPTATPVVQALPAQPPGTVLAPSRWRAAQSYDARVVPSKALPAPPQQALPAPPRALPAPPSVLPAPPRLALPAPPGAPPDRPAGQPYGPDFPQVSRLPAPEPWPQTSLPAAPQLALPAPPGRPRPDRARKPRTIPAAAPGPTERLQSSAVNFPSAPTFARPHLPEGGMPLTPVMGGERGESARPGQADSSGREGERLQDAIKDLTEEVKNLRDEMGRERKSTGPQAQAAERPAGRAPAPASLLGGAPTGPMAARRPGPQPPSIFEASNRLRAAGGGG